MSELLVVWGKDRNQVASLCDVRAAGRQYRVLRRCDFELVSAESTDGDAMNSARAAYGAVIEIQ